MKQFHRYKQALLSDLRGLLLDGWRRKSIVSEHGRTRYVLVRSGSYIIIRSDDFRMRFEILRDGLLVKVYE